MSVPVLAALALSAGCREADPQARVLQERANWKVEATGWAQTEDRIQISLRITGPVRPKLDALTVTIRLMDAGETVLEELWETLDVSDIRRGVPTETFVTVYPERADVEGVWVGLVRDPTPEQRRHLAELQDAG